MGISYDAEAKEELPRAHDIREEVIYRRDEWAHNQSDLNLTIVRVSVRWEMVRKREQGFVSAYLFPPSAGDECLGIECN